MLAEIIKNTINTLGIFYGRGCVRREGGGGASYIIQRSTKETYKVIKLAHYRFRYVFVGGGGWCGYLEIFSKSRSVLKFRLLLVTSSKY